MSYFLSLISVIVLIACLSNPASAAQSMTVCRRAHRRAGISMNWKPTSQEITPSIGTTSELSQQHWLNSGCGDANQWCGGADINASSSVDLIDYAILAKDWTKTGAQNVLLQTIYGSAQDANGTITANTAQALQNGKGMRWRSMYRQIRPWIKPFSKWRI